MSEVQALPVAEVDYKWPDAELVVRLSDYDALAAECERLRDERDSYQRIGIRNMQACDAALAELAALKGGQEAGKLQWPEIVGLVNEVLGCEAHKFPCSRGSIGHEMTGINFNSLARIIDLVRHSYPAPPCPSWALSPSPHSFIGSLTGKARYSTSVKRCRQFSRSAVSAFEQVGEHTDGRDSCLALLGSDGIAGG